MKTVKNLIYKIGGILLLLGMVLRVNAQGNFDIEVFKEQLSTTVQEDIKGKIEEEVKSWLNAGEAKALESIYWEEMLKPYEEFGIDPKGTGYYESAIEIYNSIKNDPEYDPKAELSGKLTGMLETRLDNELKKITGQYIDAESQEILTQWQGLYQGAVEKTNKILNDINKIGEWDPDASDYESKVEELVRTWGIKGNLADFIGELDGVYNRLNDSYGTQVGMGLEVLSIIRDDDPTNKIEAMFQFGMDYGDKIPLVGSIVSNLFKVGKELLAAAKRAGSMIDANIAQGCYYGVGAHGSAMLNQTGRKKEEFQRLFPNVVSACPMSQDPNSGPYRHIYIDQGNGRNVFFYFGDQWHGPSGNANNGEEDVRAIIRWLRRIQSDKYHDLKTIHDIYAKSPGFTDYRNQIENNVRAIQSLVKRNISGNSYCDQSELENYLFDAVDLNWIRRLIGNDQLSFSRAKIFDDGLIEQIADQMQENRYLKNGRANLDHLQRIITNLEQKIPVHFTGKVLSTNNQALERARITPPDQSNLIFNDERCQQLETNSRGEYMFFAIVSPNQNKVGIMATYEGISLTEEFEVNVANRRYYNFNIYLKLADEETKSPKEECEEKEGYVWDEENEVCIPALDCSTEENTVRVLNEDKTAYICDCLSPFVWNEDRTQCLNEAERDSTTSGINCEEDPNAEVVDGNCQCKEGFAENYLGNCDESSNVFTSLSISPQSQTIGVGDDPILAVTAVNKLGESVDVTEQALENTSAIGDVSGVFIVNASLQGLSAQAEVIVNECSDPNATLNLENGDCDCKDGFAKNDKEICVPKDPQCEFPNMKPDESGECKCVPGFLPAEGGGCISEDELLETLEEEALEECENLESLASEFSSLISQISYASSDFKSHSERFFKEVNDRASNLCENQVAAYSYAQALSAYEVFSGAIDKGKDVYFGLQILGQCPNYEEVMASNGLGNYDLSGFLDQSTESELTIGDMGSRIKENGCNEEDLEDVGRTVVDQDKDPELISLGGTGIELGGDGKDNDGDGQEDEIPVSALAGYNVTIVLYDSGQAKDDVFSLNVSNIGDLGTTPEGGLRSYPLQLPHDTYTATVTVLDDGGNVGTFTINVLVNGISAASLVGEPKAGGSLSVNFHVEE